MLRKLTVIGEAASRQALSVLAGAVQKELFVRQHLAPGGVPLEIPLEG